MNPAPSDRLLVFARAPVPGGAKTRLIPALGPEGAAALQACLIRHTLSITAQTGAAVELWCHPDPHHSLFTECAERFGLNRRTQKGNDLGERMQYALLTALAEGPAVLIGTDCPTLEAGDLLQAFAALRDNDAVLGPARDGGYYLLGLRRLHPSLFDGIGWGSCHVLAQTRRRLKRLGWRWTELEIRRDIDRPEDLAFLPTALHPMKEVIER